MPVNEYTPTFSMPIVGPPPSGDDPAAYYARVLENSSFDVTPVAGSGLKIELSNDLHKGIFAMVGGFITFIPPGKPLPTTAGEPSPGSGSLVLKTFPVDVSQLRGTLPPNVPPMTQILYLNVNPASVRRDLIHAVQALPTKELETAWMRPDPGSRVELENNYLDRVLLGARSVFVRGGSEIGDAERANPADPKTNFEMILRFTDSAGVDLFPLLHLRSMPGIGGDEWTGHPLITRTAGLPVPLDVYLQFEVWDKVTDTYQTLPAGIAIELVDFKFGLPVTVLATQTTDARGRVHLHLPNLNSLSDPTPDLTFLARTNGIRHAGHLLPDQWSTQGWEDINGAKGYYPDFTGMQIGAANAPLVFRIGLEIHVRLIYEETRLSPISLPLPPLAVGTVSVVPGSTTVTGIGTSWVSDIEGQTLTVIGDKTGYVIAKRNSPTSLTLARPYVGLRGSSQPYHIDPPAPPGISVSVFEVERPRDLPRHPGDPAGAKKADLKTDANGELHTLLFDVKAEDSFYLHLDFSIEDIAINLPRATVRVSPATWDSSWAYADRLDFVNVQFTSIGTQRHPRILRASFNDRNVAIFFLKVLREFSAFLFQITDGDWPGVEGLVMTLAGPPGSGFAWPVKFIHIGMGRFWERWTIVHELSHQIMWQEVGFSTLGIVYQALPIIGLLKLEHHAALLANPVHAFIEGWADFMEGIFAPPGAMPYPVSTLYNDQQKPIAKLFDPPPPTNRGEHVEGAFANGLWEIFSKHVVTTAISPDAYVRNSVNGDVGNIATWLSRSDVRDRFKTMIWKPLKDLKPQPGQPSPNQSSTGMIDKIQLENTSTWPALRAELQIYNMAF